MKSASNFWIFILLTSLLFNCASRKSPSDTLNMQKAYVLLRTEGLEAEINKLTSIINSNFVANKIASDIDYYPLGKTWKINEIFSTAYNSNYDYIILIDQVAKYTIDQRTNIGGKYQIRSYHIKSSNPDWMDLGQKTCNISVKQSVDKFSQQIISQIVPNYMSFEVTNIDNNMVTNDETRISEIDYNELKSSKEIDNEIAELKAQLKKEKVKTNEAIAEKIRLEKEYENALSLKKKNNQTIIEGLEPYKKEMELEKKEEEEKIQEAKIFEEKKKEEKRIIKAKRKRKD